MTIFRTFTPKNVSPPEVFPFSTRNFPILNLKFSHSLLFSFTAKNYCHPSHFKEKFHQKFCDDFLVIIYQAKISLHSIVLENVLILIHSYCFSGKGPRGSWYAIIYYIILQY